MGIVIGATVVVGVVGLGVEIQMARGGLELDAPDVTTLARTVRPALPATDAAPLRVLWLGDSTAAAVGTSGPDFAVSSVVARSLADADGRTIDVNVIAHSGDTVSGILHDQLDRVASLRPDLVVISVGANDTVHLVSAGKFKKRYNRLVDGLVAAGVSANHIVMVGVPDIGGATRLPQPLRALTGLRSRRLDAQVRRVAKSKHARYVNLFKGTSSQFRHDPHTLLAADRYHPSDAGYALWGRVIAPVVIDAAKD